MKELEKGQKELKGFAAHRKNNNINQPETPELPRTKQPNKRVHMERTMAVIEYEAQDGLAGLQWEDMSLVLWRLDTPV